MRRSIGTLSLAMAVPAVSAEPVDQAYIRSLATMGKTVLVVEYYDCEGVAIERKGFASVDGFRAISATDFAVTDKLAIHLFGIEPCEGNVVNRREDYAGSCAGYAEQGLKTLLASPKVIYCRALISEADASVQDATCYGYYRFTGSLDSVDMFEEQLVTLGRHRIAKKHDGSLARLDLQAAEKIARMGYGMWVDPRIQRK